MTTIFETIRTDHDTQRDLIARLIETEGDSDARLEVWTRLRTELVAHAAAEERAFYVPLIDHDETQDHARHSIAEHKELDDFVETLDEVDRSSGEWLRTARKLSERLLHHLDEEETEIFPLAGRVLTDEEKAALAVTYRDELESLRADA